MEIKDKHKFIELMLKYGGIPEDIDIPEPLKSDQRQDAIDVLLKYGVLIKVDDDIELLHGRADQDGEEWEVDPNYSSVSDAERSSGKISVLHAVSGNDVTRSGLDGRQVAQRFARVKAKGPAKQQVYKLRATGDCYMWSTPSTPLNKQQQQEVLQAVTTLTAPEQTNYAPIGFQEGELANMIMLMFVQEMSKAGIKSGPIPYTVVDAVIQRFFDGDELIIEDEDARKLIGDIQLVSAQEKREGRNAQVKKLIKGLASSYNSEYMVTHNPDQVIEWYVTGMYKDEKARINNATSFDFPISRDYIASWLLSNNIIGLKHKSYSPTVGEYSNCTIFDSSRVMTQQQYEQRQQKWQKQYGKIGDYMAKTFTKVKIDQPVVWLLMHGDRDEILKYFSEDWSEKQMFQLKSGVWEDFTILEHTKSVMRWYDINYTDQLPPQMDTLMKICILVHDSGKGIAHSEGKKYLQKQYNAEAAAKILKHIGLPEALQKIVQYIIGEGQACTSRYFLHKDGTAYEQFARGIGEVYMQAFGEQITKEQIEGLWQMCAILQNCDSGSYTLNGVTYDEKTHKYYKNGNEEWTRSFNIPSSNNPEKGGFMTGTRKTK